MRSEQDVVVLRAQFDGDRAHFGEMPVLIAHCVRAKVFRDENAVPERMTGSPLPTTPTEQASEAVSMASRRMAAEWPVRAGVARIRSPRDCAT